MSQTLIFDIQRFCVHDGPGIRTTVFFKGCPLQCIWCQNPESHKAEPEIAFYKQRYSGCPGEALKTIGTYWEAGSLLTEIEKDNDFFMDSGGGITLSGGEPVMQVQFLKRFLPLVKSKNIHVNIETCGMFQWQEMKKILPFLDLIYYDLKIMDPVLHKKFTRRDNTIILENFTRLAAVFANLQARMPIIPTLNDGPENIFSTARFLKQCRKESIHLLKYHNLGEAKLPAIQTQLQPLGMPNNSDGFLSTAAALFEKENIEAIFEE
ncbi:MAG: radical SAM protein [bacterium]|nr:radical SAM protein [bacterium]